MKVFLVILIVAFGHVHHGNHKHDHHGHSHHQVDSVPDTNLLKHTDTYFVNLNLLVKELGPLSSTIAASVLTTSASVFIFLFIWAIKRNNLLTNDLLNTLISFSCGALIGDVFLHLLPSIQQTRDSSLLVILGILVFYVLDRSLSHSHVHKEDEKSEENEESQSAILLFMADFLHNITDGMAIGASFSLGSTLGISTTIAIFLHEIAHEIGDFIAFLRFGMSLSKSLYMNLVTGIGSLIGGVIIVTYGTNEALKTWVLPVVVGNFLYVSLVSMLSTMRSKPKTTIVWEVVFFCTGVALMVVIEELE